MKKLPPGPLALDTETTGLSVWKGARPIGLSVLALWSPVQGVVSALYLPWGHESGRQLPEEAVRRWAQEELAGRSLFFANAHFDLHMLRAWGLDLEALGAQPHDVQFHAALLDEGKLSYSLEALSREYLKEGKLQFKEDGLEIWERSADEVAPYAKQDAYLTARLASYFAGHLRGQGLEKVAALEDALIYAVLRDGAEWRSPGHGENRELAALLQEPISPKLLRHPQGDGQEDKRELDPGFAQALQGVRHQARGE